MSYQRFFELLKPYFADAKPDAPYCHCRISVGWTEVGGQTKELESPGLYEQQILEFLLRDPGGFDSPENNFTVIVGGIGTGKTTTITRQLTIAFERTKTCTAAKHSPLNACSKRPQFIHLDFRDWEGDQYGKDDEARQSSFWTYAANSISQASAAPLSDHEEIHKFWPWLINQRKLYEKNLAISKFLHTERDTILAIAENKGDSLHPLGAIEKHFKIDRRGFVSSLPAQDYFWYQVFMLAYRNSLNAHDCTCAYLFIDNVDGLHVNMQKQIASLALRLCAILRSRTIICLRPLTWKHTQAEYLVDYKEHFSPPWKTVITSRLDLLEQEKPTEIAEFKEALASLRKALLTDSSLLTKMISTTSGVSVRYVLRNVYNFLESPIVATAFQKQGFVQSMSVSDLTRSYFFGARRDEIIPHAFENLYYCEGQRSDGTILIKSRILDLLHRRQYGTVSSRFIHETGQKFGYSTTSIIAALCELALRSRPLIWSEDSYDSFEPNSNGRIMLTPIGHGYTQSLFGELFYEEVCLTRTKPTPATPLDVLEHHRRITEIDLAEIALVVRNWGAYYQSLYGGDSCLSLSHWRRLSVGLSRVKETYAVELEIDEGRGAWITRQLSELLEL